jgi:hypothetical protein
MKLAVVEAAAKIVVRWVREEPGAEGADCCLEAVAKLRKRSYTHLSGFCRPPFQPAVLDTVGFEA